MPDTTDPGSFPSTAIGSGPYRASSTLPLGRWHVMANGRIHFLEITEVSGEDVIGNYNNEPLINGHWDARTRTLTFLRFIADVGRPEPLLQLFTGDLMHFRDWDPKWRMAGRIKQLSPPLRDEYGGWYATLSRDAE
jgi:hypothetical protein